ncbi:MAG: tetratricopeptide repeat protein [Vicinamibacterales bacterium]
MAPARADARPFDFEFDFDDFAVRMKEQALGAAEAALAGAETARTFAFADARVQARAAVEQAHEQLMQSQNGSSITLNGATQFRFAVSSDTYSSGLNALNQRQYDRAISAFDRVVAAKGARSDAALYWKAFAQFKLGKSDEALASLAQLRKDYAQSPYLNDAKVLDADARRSTGQRINPANLDDDEIKLLAIQGIQKSPEAVPLLEGVINATNSLALKKRALYVLALSPDARAHQVLLRYAKGAGNPDLQIEAVRYLASRGEQQTSSTELREIYDASADLNVKLAVLEAYRSSSNKPALLAIVGATNAPPEVRARAISMLPGLASADELASLYQKETDRALRMQLLSALGSTRAVDQLAQIARSEKDSPLRVRAIRSLGSSRVDQSRQLLLDLYAGEQDKDARKAIINAMGDQNNVEGLVALARKETTVELKTEIVRRLAEMAPKSKPAADYLMEVIK